MVRAPPTQGMPDMLKGWRYWRRAYRAKTRKVNRALPFAKLASLQRAVRQKTTTARYAQLVILSAWCPRKATEETIHGAKYNISMIARLSTHQAKLVWGGDTRAQTLIQFLDLGIRTRNPQP